MAIDNNENSAKIGLSESNIYSSIPWVKWYNFSILSKISFHRNSFCGLKQKPTQSRYISRIFFPKIFKLLKSHKIKGRAFCLPKTNFQTWSSQKVDAKIFYEKSLTVPKHPKVNP